MTYSVPLVFFSGPCLAPLSLFLAFESVPPTLPLPPFCSRVAQILRAPSQKFFLGSIITLIRLSLYIPLYPSPPLRVLPPPTILITREIPPITLSLYVPFISAFHSDYIL